MNLQQIYQLAIKLGIQADLRGGGKIKKVLARIKQKYDKLDSEGKKEFDHERLTNPYSDTRILNDNGKEVKKVMVGIDIQPSEILMAKELGCDTVIAHHPLGSALADLGNVMHLQVDLLADYGVPINIAEALTKERISEVARGISAVNHFRTVDAAKLLGVNLICVHTPTDNLAASYLDKVIKKAKPETVGEIIKALKTVPEYQEAVRRKTGPKIFVGGEDNAAGKIVLTEITGGTEGAVGIYEKMSQAGIGTIIGMHMDEERKKEAQKYFVNVVIAGHISSDSLGVNQFLDELERKRIEIIPCSGLIRVSRIKKAKAKPKPKPLAKKKK
ncbi:MAG: NGG1p interacting factor NIF3 [Candidatus Buchananbacteria bacterium RIFCSPHIGHO2_02_FULL_38_8]|uniref:NGG1p interacting factor NIF3 n=2 Tax=Candidatus Buchananiibacteriota TaxID=1817903 RepID=A0A1G1XVM3_9BACT|nr:MAG: NGG1p interacting factor NIF3 [Candidatus Buchananbacteria bacterium RIFCSPHIGHO2_01_FULL_39_8]OGY47578.1 MAG: NGG1p interacting factor NIF3 [Candidatus Buchananbacteria bacterium RIFCSPHIGHO2_02_FULL_38_8]